MIEFEERVEEAFAFDLDPKHRAALAVVAKFARAIKSGIFPDLGDVSVRLKLGARDSVGQQYKVEVGDDPISGTVMSVVIPYAGYPVTVHGSKIDDADDAEELEEALLVVARSVVFRRRLHSMRLVLDPKWP